MITDKELFDFVKESNSIENIIRNPFDQELKEHERFMNLDQMSVEEIESFVKVHEPNALLRDKYGLSVRIGSYYPKRGCPEIRYDLERIINSHVNAYEMHIQYEKLHPFTDGNGRSGRALWAWKMIKDKKEIVSGSFLRTFYYQTLQHYSELTLKT